jgi:alkanesulfonate monooxygenase SsuD/methylene tetrahydromethanopterin reductase-like flavin-dependent oxidoreductase (luciferase family)
LGFGCRLAPGCATRRWLGGLGVQHDAGQFAAALAKLRNQLKIFGKDPASFPNASATMFMYITEDKSNAEWLLSETLTAALHRPVDQLRERLLVGAPEICAEKLAAYKAAGFSASLCGR